MSRGSGRKPPQELKMNAQTFGRMNQTASGIVGVVETLRNKLSVLDSEIKADEDGKQECADRVEVVSSGPVLQEDGTSIPALQTSARTVFVSSRFVPLRYERQIARLEIRRAEIAKRLDANATWAETYDREIGPFQSTYESSGDLVRRSWLCSVLREDASYLSALALLCRSRGRFRNDRRRSLLAELSARLEQQSNAADSIEGGRRRAASNNYPTPRE